MNSNSVLGNAETKALLTALILAGFSEAMMTDFMCSILLVG
ncbi:hypothetical protein VCHA50P415_60009 [Vibrio chagasii]|nr:hypothetical protein VCHA29O39_100179 [Vibrio chagasii]CAH6801851.1 hypothetical protein VCHA37O173_100180 [Vibrio chagasii]CAH6907362.1 hypothetical protein VCHA41O249_110151 [Vibrio chagasii]CAH7054899.1 hypothetical protein VCHA34P129_70233 [Vibrio chagasii]CAH7072328.1 hypothetical protein VCHA36P168_70241 [Vibrio chagasii]